MHISLDSALGRQRRLNSVGESVLQIAPNAAAAYSLRSLTGGDPKVVRVRRSSGGEKDFTASGVASGAMLSYVTEARTGWNIQATFNDSTATITSASSTATTSTVSFTGSGVTRVLPKSSYIAAEAGDQVVFNMSVSGLDSAMTFRIRKANSNTTVGTATVDNGDNQDVTLDLTASSGYTGGYPHFTADAGSGEATVTINSVTVNGKSGFVETWYDQSGNSKDATQTTASLQPKIVNAGSLLTDGIDFDQTSQAGLITGSFSLTQAFTTFSVSHTDDTSDTQGVWATATDATATLNSASFFRNDDGFAVNAGTTLTTAGTIDYVADRTYLQTNVVNGGSSSIFVDGATGATGNAGSTNPSGVLIIGYFKSGGYFNLDGGIKELIIYDSDQTSNRAALETNIAAANGVTLS
jgi:hypothetical protein